MISLLSVGGVVVPAVALDVATDRALAHHPYAVHGAEAARRFGIPEKWIWAVMRVESHGDSRAVSSAGAMGLMQIMPATWADLSGRYGLGDDPFDVRANIMAGAAYLRAMHDRYGNVAAMLAAYNAGPGRYDEHLTRGRPLPSETRAYLARLASIIGDTPGELVAAAPSTDPFAWRRAVLFVRTAGGDAAGTQPSSEPRTSDSETAADAPVNGPADGVFVVRTRAARPQ